MLQLDVETSPQVEATFAIGSYRHHSAISTGSFVRGGAPSSFPMIGELSHTRRCVTFHGEPPQGAMTPPARLSFSPKHYMGFAPCAPFFGVLYNDLSISRHIPVHSGLYANGACTHRKRLFSSIFQPTVDSPELIVTFHNHNYYISILQNICQALFCRARGELMPHALCIILTTC